MQVFSIVVLRLDVLLTLSTRHCNRGQFHISSRFFQKDSWYHPCRNTFENVSIDQPCNEQFQSVVDVIQYSPVSYGFKSNLVPFQNLIILESNYSALIITSEASERSSYQQSNRSKTFRKVASKSVGLLPALFKI